ncbi:hypothetical protein GX48_03261 [Paracoccidioides brasiliensis]|nr:hypothetical protein GX48_03261 [Paracoccidioides brasiliensis]
MGSIPLESRIASLVHSHFDDLPQRSKPTIHPNGSREWVPLSGIVLVTGENTPHEALTCVAIATGTKCLPTSQIRLCRGLVLHDSHAEVLVIRAFNHWLLEECKMMLQQWKGPPSSDVEHDGETHAIRAEYTSHQKKIAVEQHSKFINWRHRLRTENEPASVILPSSSDFTHPNNSEWPLWPPFQLRNDLKIYMYSTCAPCGDASMEVCMAAQDDPTPWVIPLPYPNTESSNDNNNEASHSETNANLLNGRAHFSILGAVRRKPSRADAESTLSKSCSDKLAVKQVTSLLTFPTCLLIVPSPDAYLAALLLPENEISQIACARAFGGGETGRLKKLNGQRWKGDDILTPNGQEEYMFRPFEVRSIPNAQVKKEWAFGKPSIKEVKSKPGNISAVWTAAPSYTMAPEKLTTQNLSETLINGVKQGYRHSSPTPRKASSLSRAKMWDLFRDIVQLLPSAEINISSGSDYMLDPRDSSHYLKVKECVCTSQTYEVVKRKCIELGLGPVRVRKEVLSDVRVVLGNWVENRGDENWGLYVLDNEMKVRKAQRQDQISVNVYE